MLYPKPGPTDRTDSLDPQTYFRHLNEKYIIASSTLVINKDYNESMLSLEELFLSLFLDLVPREGPCMGESPAWTSAC